LLRPQGSEPCDRSCALGAWPFGGWAQAFERGGLRGRKATAAGVATRRAWFRPSRGKNRPRADTGASRAVVCSARPASPLTTAEAPRHYADWTV